MNLITLQRITTLYVEDEDRMQIAGEGGDQSVQTLWLSHRLLDRLVLKLVCWLAMQHDSVQADVLQSFAQEAALQSMTPQPSVNTRLAAANWLVKSIDVTTSPNVIRLTFKDHVHEVQLVMQSQFLRQWLIILRTQYQVAGWDVQAWPEWLAAPHKVAPDQALWH